VFVREGEASADGILRAVLSPAAGGDAEGAVQAAREWVRGGVRGGGGLVDGGARDEWVKGKRR